MLKTWFTPDLVSRKRFEIQQLLHKLMEEQNIDASRLNLPFLGLKDGNNSMEFSENEEEDTENAEEEEEVLDEEEEEGELGMGEEEEEGEVHLERNNHLHEDVMDEEEQEYESENENNVTSTIKTNQIVFCGNDSTKRKSSLSLKDIRNPRLVSCKKIRSNDD